MVLKKSGSKRDSTEIFGSEYCKVVFTSLYEIIAIYMELTLIYIWCFSLKKSLSKLIKSPERRSSNFQDCLKNLLKIIFEILGYLQGSERRSWIRETYKKPWKEGLRRDTRQNTRSYWFVVSTWSCRNVFWGPEYAIDTYSLWRQPWPRNESMAMAFVRIKKRISKWVG